MFDKLLYNANIYLGYITK